MPHRVPLRAGDPRRVGGYALDGRLAGLPSNDPIFTGTGPDGALVSVSLLSGGWDAAAMDRFADEAAGAQRVPPFCAARVLDAGLDGQFAYLVSEYIPGPSLIEVVAADGILAGPQLESLAVGMATGLASVHQAGLVHGSFGPQDVILPAGGPPCVVEYGITPPYGAATPSADMLAWAQTVLFAATGQPPSAAPDLGVLPAHIREPVRQCLELDSAEIPAARAVVQYVLGGSQQSGLLAEGSRHAAQQDWVIARPDPDPALTPGRSSGPRRAGRPGPPGPPSDPGRSPAGGYGRVAVAARRRRGRWVLGSTAAVLVVIAAVVGIVLSLSSGGSKAGSPTAATASLPASTSSSSAAPVPRILHTVKATHPFVGTWSGDVRSALSTNFQVTVSFPQGSSQGHISYDTSVEGKPVSCSNYLDVTAASRTTMSVLIGTSSLNAALVSASCAKGQTATVTSLGPDQISFSLPLGGGAHASGNLTRH